MSQLIVNILDSFLGESHRHNTDTGQLQYDCPACSEAKGLYKGDGKGNLEVNYVKNVFKCWSCYDINNMGGSLVKLIKRYGNQQNLKDYQLVNPELYEGKEKSIVSQESLKLPEGFTLLNGCPTSQFRYKEVTTYLKNRGITDEIIFKYNIGYTTIGKYANRVIVPSYNLNGELDFFVARAFVGWIKPKYLNPIIEKHLLLFNESKINWDATIYLVEGVFDGIVIPNSIPMLGKMMSERLFYDLQFKASGLVVIALDGDAYDDALKLYKKLNVLNLYNRIRLIKLNEDWDLSLINEKFGKKGIVYTLQSAHKIPESRL